MKRAQRTAAQTESSFKRSFGNLGNVVKAGLAGAVSGLSLGLLVQGAKAALDYAGSLGEVAQQLGVTTRELQVFRFAVQQNGGTVENADQALGKFAIAISKALAGSKQAAAAFGAMGVSLGDLQSKSKTEVLGQIADRMKQTGGASANAAAGVAIFGRGFQKIVPVLDQGSAGFSELARAADELGIVLSDEQIQNADQTADKLDALMTVLKVKIAGDIANNTDSILDFANALFDLVRAAESARAALVNFQRNYNLPNLLFKGDAFGKGVKGRSVTTDLSTGGMAAQIARARGLKLAGEGGGVGSSVPQFLAKGGGGKSKRSGADDAERKRLEALRNAHQFDQDILRAQMDVVRAQQQLATDYSERAALSIQLLNLDQQSFQRQLEYEVAAGELTKAQAAQLEAEFVKRDALERQAVLAEEEAQRKEDYNRLDQLDFDLQRDILESQEQLAETAKEQRELRLKILDLDYRAEKARLEAVLADEKIGWAAKEEARRRLANLDKTKANDEQGVKNSTRGPLGDYLNSLPTTAEKWNEALEEVAVNGLKSVEDGLLDILDGTKSVGEAFRDMAQGIIRDLLKIAIRRFITAPIANALFGGMSEGGLAGYASGGWVSGPGTGTSDSIPAMLSNGEFVINAKATKQFLPLLEHINDGSFPTFSRGGISIPRMSHGARLDVSNDNQRMGGGAVTMNFAFSGPVSRETQAQVAAAARRGIASANRKGF